jgi:hypothetical protein
MKAIWIVALLGAAAWAEPYRLWWLIPLDDASAIEVDDADLGQGHFASRWQLAMALGRCDKPKRRRAGLLPMRELRIESLDGEGRVRTTRHCMMTVAEWELKLGAPLVERLDDELDAHQSFLNPRHRPSGRPAAD